MSRVKRGVPGRARRNRTMKRAKGFSGGRSKLHSVAKEAVDKVQAANTQHIAFDHDGDPVFLTRLQWDIDRIERDYPDLTLTATKEMMV